MKSFKQVQKIEKFVGKFLYSIGFIFFLLLISSNCKNEENKSIIIKNNSADSICALYTEIYPDTTLDCRVGYWFIGDLQQYQLSLRNGWQDELDRIGILQIFIIDKIVWKTEPCDTIRKYNKILKRYQLTLQDLESLNWNITYP